MRWLRYRAELLGTLRGCPVPSPAAAVRIFYAEDDADATERVAASESGDFEALTDYRLVEIGTGRLVKDWASEEHGPAFAGGAYRLEGGE